MNKYQKLLVQATKLYMYSYKGLFGEVDSFRYSRCQVRQTLKEDKINHIDLLRADNRLIRFNLGLSDEW